MRPGPRELEGTSARVASAVDSPVLYFAMRTYEDFEVQISVDRRGFRAQAKDAGGSQRFKLDAAALTERWNRLSVAFAGRARVSPEEIKDAEALGGELFRAVFTGNILFAWGTALARAAATGKGVRLVLRVQESGSLAMLPWELLFDAGNREHLALSASTPIVRYPDVLEPARPLALRPPFRLLGVLANPLGQPLLDLEGEWMAIEKAFAPLKARGLVEIERLVSPSLWELRERLKQEPAIHALHLAGHGVALPEHRDSEVHLERGARDRHAEPALGSQLAVLAAEAVELRLVVVNACEGATAPGGESTASLAFRLASRGVPAVVALQSALCDRSAHLFAQTFYGEIAQGSPIDEAIAEARGALHAAHKGLAWAAPVLYLRAPSGHLLERREEIAPDYQPVLSPRVGRTRQILFGAMILGILAIVGAAIAGKQLYTRLSAPPARRPLPQLPVLPPYSDPLCPSLQGLEFSFVRISPGAFQMGAPAKRGDRKGERPEHSVQITKDFCVGAFEVTQDQWDAVLTNQNALTRRKIDFPKVRVGWEEIQTFLAKLNERDPAGNYRLLTEAEFEYAARSGSAAANVYGDSKEILTQDANCLGAEDGFNDLAPIGSFRPNRRGLFDVQGNAQEWVEDWYAAYSPSAEPQVDPQGPSTGTDRVRRGGSFNMNPKNCALWSRSSSEPNWRSNDLGFRIARTPIQNSAQ